MHMILAEKKNYLFLKIALGLFLGTIFAVYFIQKQSPFKQVIEKKIYNLVEKNFHSRLNLKVEKIDIFRQLVVLNQINMQPQVDIAQDWSWIADRITIKFSWFSFIMHGKLPIEIEVDNLELNTTYNQKLAISQHLYDLLFAPSSIPLELKSLNINHGLLKITTTDQSIQLNWASQTKVMSNNLLSNIYLKDGLFNINSQGQINGLTGLLQLTIPINGKTQEINLNSDLNFCLPSIDNQSRHFLSGAWQNNQGKFKLNSIDDAIKLPTIKMQLNKNLFQIQTKGTLSLNLLTKLAKIDQILPLSGDANVDLKFQTDAKIWHMQTLCQIINPNLHGKTLAGTCQLKLNHDADRWKGKIKIKSDENNIIWSKLSWNALKQAGKYLVNIHFDDHKKTKTVFGNLNYTAPHLNLTGNLDDYQCHLTVNKTAPYIHSFELKNAAQDELCSIKPNLQKPTQLDSSINLELINHYLGSDIISSHGNLKISSQLIGQRIMSKIDLTDGSLIIPKVYNAIQEMHSYACFDLQRQTLKIKNAQLRLHKGKITIPQASMQFNPNWKIASAHLPIFLNNCTFNLEKNLIANLSGKILYQQKQSLAKPSIGGFCLIGQSLCKYNLLAADLQNLFNKNSTSTIPEFELDLHIATSESIKIQSETLQTGANAQLQIKNTLSNPQIIGQVTLIGGKINFPYKPLYITQGNIYFSAEQPQQPIINLVAKSSIKNFNITMHLSGSLYNPHISLESSPSLTAEQIGALLLAGSENSSLNTIMPALVMQNINQILFGQIYNQQSEDSFLKTIFKPLDHIRFVPSFSDETGRGGLRAAIEIDVNDRLHGLIQKNFSLSEDTRIEVDYAISDDVRIRGIQDERGDLGGEVEIRLRI